MSTLAPTYTDDIFNLSIPVLAVDIVLFTIYKEQLCIVLVPGRNEWAEGKLTLPGWIIGRGETLEEAADRILYRDTNISKVYKEQLYTFSAHGRDTRWDVISCVYYTLVDTSQFLSQIDLTRVSLIPVGQISKDNTAYDHAEIIAYAKKRLEWKMEYTDVVKNILPEEFTFTRLQKMYEIVFGKMFDKRNFRKKIQWLDMITESGWVDRSGSKRPAKLYRFTTEGLNMMEVF
jgi:8-oxo-dGTP diphosphatase